MKDFELTSDYKPTGDQPEAIEELVKGVKQGAHSQVLLGVTGSGKTFTVANVIQELLLVTLLSSLLFGNLTPSILNLTARS